MHGTTKVNIKEQDIFMSRIALFACLLCILFNEHSMNPPRYETDVRQVESVKVLRL